MKLYHRLMAKSCRRDTEEGRRQYAYHAEAATKKSRVLLFLFATILAILIGLICSRIGYADRPSEDEQAITAAQLALNSTVKITPPLSHRGWLLS